MAETTYIADIIADISYKKPKKARDPNWPTDQTNIVRSEVMKNYPILFGGFSNNVDFKRKQTWSDIADKVNSVEGTVRNVAAIKDKWKNLKNASISTMREHAKHTKGTGKYKDDRITIMPPRIPNGLVFYLHTNTDKKEFIGRLVNVATRSGIIEERSINVNALTLATLRLVTDINNKKRSNLKRNGKNVTLFLNECFVIPRATGADIATTYQERKGSEDAGPVIPSPKKLKTDCVKCPNRRKTVKHLMQLNRKRKRDLDDSFIFNYEKRALTQALERKQDTEKQLRSDRRVLTRQLMEKTSEIERLKATNVNSAEGQEKKKKRRRRRVPVNGTLAAAQKEHVALKKINNNLQRENECLHAIITEDKDNESKTISVKKDMKTYSTGYRKAAYSCILKQVPVESTKDVSVISATPCDTQGSIGAFLKYKQIPVMGLYSQISTQKLAFHWILFTNIGTEEPDVVRVYDSFRQTPSKSAIREIADFHHTNSDNLQLEIMNPLDIFFTNIGTEEPDVVQVYDSFRQTPSKSAIREIADFHHTNFDNLQLEIMNVAA
ncbi:hypothetical protein GQR58_016318 [Nymphon striatum]|nr:hypothetical protein GQR58_016318 [Nymphon striatum]